MIIEIVEALKQTLLAMAGWLYGYPLTRIIRRNPDLIIVISSPGSSFADNSKYFYVYSRNLIREGKRVVFLTGDHSVQNLINHAGGESVIHPSWRSINLLLRCGIIVTDWVIINIYPITRGAKIVQIWHGAPLKQIELDTHRKRLAAEPFWMRTLIRIQKAVIGRYPTYDLLATTSNNFIVMAFHRCFKARDYIVTGYPRNDILFDWFHLDSETGQLASINVDQRAMERARVDKSRGAKICMYIPTFRKDMDNPFDSQVDLNRLSAFAQQQSLLVVLKLHPLMHGRYRIEQYPHLLEYAPLGDVYPLMALTDILITDYSSIYFDYLLLNRPILFYPYDLEQYLSQDREMYFDYHSMTPGAKCFNYDELEYNIELLLKSGCSDQYADFRKKIIDFTHDYIDNQSNRRLYDAILRI